MKKFLPVLLPILFLVASCGKELSLESKGSNPPGTGGGGGGTNNNYHLTAKVNGTAKTFNEELFAAKLDTAGMTMYSIGGYANSDPNDQEVLAFAILSVGALNKGAYSVTNLTSLVIGQYTNADGSKEYYTFTGDQSSDPFTITITAISATEISGTIKGKIFEVTGTQPTPTSPAITITEGSFKAKIQ